MQAVVTHVTPRSGSARAVASATERSRPLDWSGTVARRSRRRPFPSELLIDDYLAGLPLDQRAALERVRAIVADAAPGAEAGTSYGIPALRYRGKPLIGFHAAKRHLSVHPFSPAVIEAVGDRLVGFDVAKGTIRFTPDMPLPEDVIRELVALRLAELS